MVVYIASLALNELDKSFVACAIGSQSRWRCISSWADDLGLVLFWGGIGCGHVRLSREGSCIISAGVDDKPFGTGK
jgi:hypothetical protein